jgi:RNA polymerase sigma factor (sigma-70 family)
MEAKSTGRSRARIVVSSLGEEERRAADLLPRVSFGKIGHVPVSAAFESYLRAEDEASLEATLADLMAGHARPIVRRVVLARLAGRWDDVDDVCSEAGLELLLHLRRARGGAAERTIDDFPSYVAAVAANACNRYFRRRRPGRARLKKQIQIVAADDPGLETASSRQGRPTVRLSRGGATSEAPADSDLLERTIEPERDLGRLIIRILEEAGGAMDLDALVNLVARIWRLPDEPSDPAAADALENVEAREPSPETAIDERRFTSRLWREIRLLPREQRIALLLHLRDRRGNSVLYLLPVTGVAGFPEIAAALGMDTDGLSRLWNELPSDDLAIAAILGCERQRVINLRMAARKRLAHRMRRMR